MYLKYSDIFVAAGVAYGLFNHFSQFSPSSPDKINIDNQSLFRDLK